MMSDQTIPETMTVVVLTAYSGSNALHIEERPVPKPGKNEVLVKVAFSPINPSDLATLEGHYGFDDPTPLIPGGEGSGEVVAAGPGMLSQYFLGKKVACTGWGSGGGIWCQYVVKSVKGGVLPLHKSLSLEQGAMSVVNPLTASAFLEIAKRGGHQSLVITAATSSLSQMVNRLAREAGIQMINIVRSEAQKELLLEQGAPIVLNSTTKGFHEQLKQVCEEHHTRLAFDAVAGPLTGEVLEALSRDGRVIVYSALSRKAVVVSPGTLIFENKGIASFWLGPYLKKQSLFRIVILWKRAQRQITGSLQSTVRKIYPLVAVKEAIDEYKSQMTGGKILLKMH